MRGKEERKSSVLSVHCGYGLLTIYLLVSQIIPLQMYSRGKEVCTGSRRLFCISAVLVLWLHQVCTASAIKNLGASWFLDSELEVIQLCTIFLAEVPHSGLETNIASNCSWWKKKDLREDTCILLLQAGLR